MKTIDKINRVVVSEEIESVNRFKIATSAKAFRILSSGLYSDKILAVIRELSTNAYDSHVAAGHTEKNFDVHLPSEDALTFYVRDYGTGLSKEDVENIYTTYFMSNKNDSNDYVGCLGLGSKSPFAYTDNFLVISYFNGTEYVYSSFLDGNGNPSLALLNEGPTTEANGMKIEMSVLTQDCNQFFLAATKAYRWFEKHKPNFVNKSARIPNCDKPKLDSKLPSTDRWWFYESDQLANHAIACMGNIGYSLSKYPAGSFTPQQELLLQQNICITFDIGMLDIEASREGISYDKVTINHIKFKLDEIISELQKFVEDKIISCKSYYTACVAYYTINRSSLRTICDITKANNMRWNGVNIQPYISVEKHGQNLKQDASDIYLEAYYMSSYRNTLKYAYVHRGIDVSTKHHIFIDDLPRGGKSRIRNFAMDNRDDTIYMITPDSEGTMFAKLLDKMVVDADTFPKTSSLPKPVYAPRKKSVTAKGDILEYNYTGRVRDSWTEFTDYKLTEDRIVYVVLDKFQVKNKNDDNVDVYTVQDIINKMNQLNPKVKINLYGIKKQKLESIIETLSEDYEVINLYDYVTEYLKTLDIKKMEITNFGATKLNDFRDLIRFYKQALSNMDNTIINSEQFLINLKNDLDTLKKTYYNNNNELYTIQRLETLCNFAHTALTKQEELAINTEISGKLSTYKKIYTPLSYIGVFGHDHSIRKEAIKYILKLI